MNEEQVKKLVDTLVLANVATRMKDWHVSDVDTVEFKEAKKFEAGANEVLDRVWEYLNWYGVFEDED